MAVDVRTMDIKKNHPTAANDQMLSTTKAVQFIGDVKTEFKKISWTSKEELRIYTMLVVAATVVFGMGIYFVDLAIQTALAGLNLLISWIV